MLKFEWPLILPDDPRVSKRCRRRPSTSANTSSISRARTALPPGSPPLPGDVTLHLACHARAQNMGQKAAEMLRLVPDTKVEVIERCSGHGGSWGVKKGNFEVALKVGKPVARQAAKGDGFVSSECPLAGTHIVQGMERSAARRQSPHRTHPIEIWRRAYGLAAASKETRYGQAHADAADIMPSQSTPRSARTAQEYLRKEAVAPRRGRPIRDVLFRELRDDVAQVQEMLYIEKGGDEQIADELAPTIL